MVGGTTNKNTTLIRQMRRVLADTHTPYGRIIMMDFQHQPNPLFIFAIYVSVCVCSFGSISVNTLALQSNNKVRNVRTRIRLLHFVHTGPSGLLLENMDLATNHPPARVDR